jgi:hypothetical protein
MLLKKEEFRDFFWNMKAMKYYEPDLSKQKAQNMIENIGDNYLAMQKWDGEWNMAIILEDEVLMRGRNTTVSGDYKNRAEWLPQIVEELQLSFSPGTVLLGEIAYEEPSKTSKDVGRIMRCNPPKALQRQKDGTPLSFFIFDVLAFEYEDIHKRPFKDRITYAYKTKTNQFDYVFPPELISTDFMQFAEDVWADGGEGLVIIKKDEPYRPGSRKAWTSLKLKKKLGEIKVKVTNTFNPTKEYSGKELETWKFFAVEKNIKFGDVGSPVWTHVEFTQDRKTVRSPEYRTIPVTKPYYYRWKSAIEIEHNGNKISVASGLTDSDKEWLSTLEARGKIDNGELYAIITGMEITDDSIRHPVFLRFDK